MKICLINNLYQPYEHGGAEVVAENQVNDFISQGHDVFVITTQPLFKKINPATSLKYKVYRFYPWNIFSFYYLNKLPVFLRAIWRLLDIFNFYSYFKIKSILNKERPDIVYGHNLTGFGYLIPATIKKSKVRYIQVTHDVVLIRPSGLLLFGKEKENILIKLYTLITKFLFNSPDQIHFPSHWLKNYYDSYGFFPASEKQVIRNFKIRTEDLLSRKQLKNPAKINFLFVGQIEKHKGILFLIKSFYKLRVTDYELHIVGAGSQLKQAKQLASHNKNIIFHGYQSAKKFLPQADYTIVPSLCYENSPTIIFQSLAAGVPVIASNLGGIPELIENNKNGYLFAPVDKESLLNILKSIIIKANEQTS